MSMLNAFFGTLGGVRVVLPLVAVSSQGTGGQIATYRLDNTGNVITVSTVDGTIDQGDWVTPVSAAGANYEVRATVTAGALSSGTTGSWLSLGTTRNWTCQAVVASVVQATITIEIRSASTLAVLDTTSVDIYAERY